MKRWQTLLGGLVLITAQTAYSAAEPRLPGIIGNQMVLQQHSDVPIWGWSEPGEEISVIFGSQSKKTRADASGRWSVILSDLEPGGPWEMRIEGETNLTLKDVLVGEVWICSGQSNMEFPLGSTLNSEHDLAQADYPQVRLFTVPRASSLEPRRDTASRWEVCTPETAKDFSAVGYFFGRRLHTETEFPIGLIDSSWGGTQAEEWTARSDLEMHSEFAPILQRWQDVSPETKSLFLKPTPFELWIDDLQLLPMEDEGAGSIADFEDFKLQTNLGGTWSDEWVDPKGAYALRIVSPGHNKSAAAARIHGEIEVSHWPMIRVDFQSEQKPIDFGGFRGLRFFSRGEGFFRLHFLQPSISDWDHYSTTTFKATPDWTPTVVLFEDLRQAGWGKKVPFTPSELTGLIIEPRLASKAIARPPSGLFNGMIMPVIPYSIRGAIWYQGEGNSGRAHQYRKLLPTMIQGWRRHWKQGDFPFLIVQLPNYGALKSQPGESKWAELREAQLMCLTLPQTGLAVTIDVGEADDVHPRNKKPVGERLAAWALATSYGKKGVFSGPLFKSVKFQGNRGIVSFQHTGSGLVAGDGTRLRGFAVAGVDRKFHWAEAQIVGDTVEIYSREVANPVAIRYAWADNPDCNLYNKEGYPAAPFRTDDWPGLTRDVQ